MPLSIATGSRGTASIAFMILGDIVTPGPMPNKLRICPITVSISYSATRAINCCENGVLSHPLVDGKAYRMTGKMATQ